MWNPARGVKDAVNLHVVILHRQFREYLFDSFMEWWQLV